MSAAMKGKPQEAGLDYASLKSFFEFYETRYQSGKGLPPEAHPLACLEVLEKRGKGMALRGLRMAINDCVEQSLRFEPDEVEKLDSELSDLGIVTLSVLRRQYSKRYATIMKRGQIKSETDYYLA